jgi:hydrogenase maturation protein HypF
VPIPVAETDHTDLALPRPGPPVLAVGADLKNAPCATAGARAVLAPPLGDLATPAALDRLERAVDELVARTGEAPSLVAHDAHPDYHGTRFARRLAARWGIPALAVQHHHAHALACLVDAGHHGPALALTLDGAGYGADGHSWGGELLRVDGLEWQRLAHLAYLPLPGGDRAAREPWRVALAACHRLAGGGDPGVIVASPPWRAAGRTLADGVWTMLEQGGGLPRSSSLGRLLDAAASLLGVCHRSTHEGQAAVALQAAAESASRATRLPHRRIPGDGGPEVVDLLPALGALVDALAAGASIPELAAGLHEAVADGLAGAAVAAAARTGLDVVALSGGCCVNGLLVGGLRVRLERAGLRVRVHRRVPPGDGGLGLGQAWAGILDASERAYDRGGRV